MLLEAFNDTKYLEKLTGLDKLFDEGEAALESIDWDDDGEEIGDDFWIYRLKSSLPIYVILGTTKDLNWKFCTLVFIVHTFKTGLKMIRS